MQDTLVQSSLHFLFLVWFFYQNRATIPFARQLISFMTQHDICKLGLKVSCSFCTSYVLFEDIPIFPPHWFR